MAGRISKKGAASGVVPPVLPCNDLTEARGLTSLSGERVVDVARKTLDASERLIGAWDELEPIVRGLLGKVRTYAESDDVHTKDAAALLRDIATVAALVGSAATGVMRASEGQVRLAVLIEGPKPTRKAPGELTEKQLVSVVLETARKVKQEQGICPLCTTTVAAPTAAAATNGGEPCPS